jgi:hypothetical protein
MLIRVVRFLRWFHVLTTLFFMQFSMLQFYPIHVVWTRPGFFPLYIVQKISTCARATRWLPVFFFFVFCFVLFFLIKRTPARAYIFVQFSSSFHRYSPAVAVCYYLTLYNTALRLADPKYYRKKPKGAPAGAGGAAPAAAANH